MLNRPFSASAWLSHTNCASNQSAASLLPPQSYAQLLTAKSTGLHSCFIPGWHGEGLLSKSSVKLKNTLKELAQDARVQFQSFKNTNFSFKNAVFEEFTSFINDNEFDDIPALSLIDDAQALWNHLFNPDSPAKNILTQFLDRFCFQAVTIYVLKIRFILNIIKVQNLKTSDNILMNPNSFLGSIFQMGGPLAMDCEALKKNTFSWYRPSGLYKDLLEEVKSVVGKLSVAELMKVTTFCKEAYIVNDHLNFRDRNYSHSLSHLATGLFINQFILQFPKWSEAKKTCVANQTGPKVINTKFTGQYISSLSQSHWLAQESKEHVKWNNIISPEFMSGANLNKAQGSYLKIFNELHFLNFLVTLSSEQHASTLSFVSRIMREKYSKQNIESELPMSALWKNQESVESKTSLLYDRIILNLPDMPKTNPHHFLVTQINSQLKDLTHDGLLFVLTNQKLFVPSHSERTGQLLESVSCLANVSLEEVKGKGELSSFLYILKKKPKQKTTQVNSVLKTSQKESCYSFRCLGPLQHFGLFQKIVSSIENFFQNKSNTTPAHRHHIDNSFLLEFFQDAIIDGKLINSADQDSKRVTHPHFFKNLTELFLPLENLFAIEQFSAPNDHISQNQTLMADAMQINQFPLLLVVNYTQMERPEIELTSMNTFEAKREKYGTAFYAYFGLLPKVGELNINIFRDYFTSDIGRQVLQLSLGNGPTKMKSKVRGLLIPKFFLQTDFPIEAAHHQFFKMSADNLINLHPDEFKKSFKYHMSFIMKDFAKYPWYTSGLLSALKQELEKMLDQFGLSGSAQNINYTNPLVINGLTSCRSHSLFPRHPDIYTKMLSPQINSVLTRLQLQTDKEDNQCLQLIHQNEVIAELYSEKEMLLFLKFIMNEAKGASIGQILQGVQVPSINDLKQSLKSFQNAQNTFKDATTEITQELNGVFFSQSSKHNA